MPLRCFHGKISRAIPASPYRYILTLAFKLYHSFSRYARGLCRNFKDKQANYVTVRGGNWLWRSSLAVTAGTSGQMCSVQVFMSKKTSAQRIRVGFTVQNAVLWTYSIASGSGTHSRKICWVYGDISRLSARNTSIFTLKVLEIRVLNSSAFSFRAADIDGFPSAQNPGKPQSFHYSQAPNNIYSL